jgi:chemotaxis protein methyltransferase CheR
MVAKSGSKSISEMIPKLLYDPSFFEELLFDFSVTVTEMFRDPDFFLAVRQKVIPYLKTHPFIKIWHAGCATGEEVYSMAILLQEEGLYDRCTIFATDFNDSSIKIAKDGIYRLDGVQKFTKNYQAAGGKNSFSDYYLADYDSVIMDQSLKKNVTFANHNLVSDHVFSEMHLILCRNVMIYFDKTLQNRVFKLFSDSLSHKGFLCLGNRESLRFSDVFTHFKAIDEQQRIYSKNEITK